MAIIDPTVSIQTVLGYQEGATRGENPDSARLDLASALGSDAVTIIDPYAVVNLPTELRLRASLQPVVVEASNNAQAQLLAVGAPSNPAAINLYQDTGRFAGAGRVNDEAFNAQERLRTISAIKLIYNNVYGYKTASGSQLFSGTGAAINGYPLQLGAGNLLYQKPFAVQPSGSLTTLSLYYTYNSGLNYYAPQTDTGFASNPGAKLVSPLDSAYSGAPGSWQAIKLSNGSEILAAVAPSAIVNRQFYRAYGGDYLNGFTADKIRQKCFRISALAWSDSGSGDYEWNSMMFQVSAPAWGLGGCRTRIGSSSDLLSYEDVLAVGSHLSPN
ncbi:MAG: hypothetical protein FJX22_03985, partial [Alphaproteobacteria bacterium]|nr:hypothetical protein [Alphaproteobacteria bacterium]